VGNISVVPIASVVVSGSGRSFAQPLSTFTPVLVPLADVVGFVAMMVINAINRYVSYRLFLYQALTNTVNLIVLLHVKVVLIKWSPNQSIDLFTADVNAIDVRALSLLLTS
jgi:uncharacterized ion transporter superfamily protein YfcC